MAVSNQNIVRVAAREPFDKGHTYCMMHLDALQLAMNDLKGETLKLWLYCNKNQDNYQFDLSQKALQSWGLKKDAYQTARKKLIELGYLVPLREDSNILVFYEVAQSEKQIQSEKPTTQQKSEESEKPTMALSNSSEKPTTLSEKPTSQSEKAQRNNTILHNNTNNNNTVFSSEGKQEEEEKKEAIAEESVKPCLVEAQAAIPAISGEISLIELNSYFNKGDYELIDNDTIVHILALDKYFKLKESNVTLMQYQGA